MHTTLPLTVVLPHLIFGGFLLAALYCGIQLVRLEARRESNRPGLYADLCFWMLIASVVGGRMAAMLQPTFFDEPWRFFYFWQGGDFYGGGLPAAVVAGMVYLFKARMSIWAAADAFAPAVAAGFFFVQAGCFYSGLCHRSSLPPMALETMSGHLPPFAALELFLAAGGLLGFFALLKLRQYKQFQGQVFWTAIALGGLLHASAASLYDGMPPGNPAVQDHSGQSIALLVMIGAGGMLACLASRKDRTDDH